MAQESNVRVPSVLLVEDEFLIAEMVRETLTEHGFEVHAFSNAADALTHLSCNNQVDIMFTDINLAGEMDGAALAQKARDLRPDLPVVFASGRWSLLERLRAFPNSVILQKPYSLTRACEAVERYKRTTGLPVMAQPNAGQPKLVDMKVVYDETPEQMVCGVVPLLESGADIIGACCGSTPRHIRAFRDAMDRYIATHGATRTTKAGA